MCVCVCLLSHSTPPLHTTVVCGLVSTSSVDSSAREPVRHQDRL